MTAMLARPLAPRRLADDRAASRATAQKRLMIMMLLYGAAVSVVVGKLGFFGFASGSAVASTMGDRTIRGDIVDRNGEPLARTIDAWAIGVHPEQILGDRHEIAQLLAARHIERRIAARHRRLELRIQRRLRLARAVKIEQAQPPQVERRGLFQGFEVAAQGILRHPVRV